MPNLNLIISEWISKGILDNSIVEMLWQYFTKKKPVSDETSRAALDLLKMACLGRRTIIMRNIKLVSTVAFQDRREDLLTVKSACEILAMAGNEKQDITNTDHPFRIKLNDPMWNDVKSIFVDNFLKKCKFFNQVSRAIIDCIYSVNISTKRFTIVSRLPFCSFVQNQKCSATRSSTKYAT